MNLITGNKITLDRDLTSLLESRKRCREKENKESVYNIALQFEKWKRLQDMKISLRSCLISRRENSYSSKKFCLASEREENK